MQKKPIGRGLSIDVIGVTGPSNKHVGLYCALVGK